jgi:hypothetical protein
MCTIMTLSREFYELNKDQVLKRIELDARGNNDGWALILLGERPSQTVQMQSLMLEPITKMIESNSKWTRMFLHARLATTSTAGIHGCHNFSTIGTGLKKDLNFGAWLVQHNGILRHPESRKYLVDSMYIAEKLRTRGLIETKKYLLEVEDYANVFLVNIQTGKFSVTRSVTGSLHTDGLGNYSSQPITATELIAPVGHKTSYDYDHPFIFKTPTEKLTKQERKDRNKSVVELFRQEINTHADEDVIKQECDAWGYNALKIYQEYEQFCVAAAHLGYLDEDKYMPRYQYEELSIEKRKWVKSLKITVEAVKEAKSVPTIVHA